MGKTILIRRGTEVNVPSLQEGEPGFSIDTKQLFIGTGSYGNVKINTGGYQPNPAAADQGATGNSDTLKYAVDTISTNSETIVFRHDSGNVNTTFTLTTSESVPANIKLSFENGAILDGAGTLTLNSLSQIIASPDQQIFGSSITISPTYCGTAHPEWWGAKGDGSTDNSDAIQTALDLAIASSGKLEFSPGGVYKITGQLNINTDSKSMWRIIGNGAAIVQYTDNTPIFQFDCINNFGWVIDGLSLGFATQQPNTNTNAYAIAFDGTSGGSGIYNFTIRNCYIYNAFRGIGQNAAAGKTFPVWGAWLENLIFSETTGAVIRLMSPVAQGQPGIHLNNIYVRCDDISDEPAIRLYAATQFQMDNIELNLAVIPSGFSGNSIVSLDGGCQGTIGTIKLEGVTIEKNNFIFLNITDARVIINRLGFTSCTLNVATGCYIISGGTGTTVEVGYLHSYGNTLTSGQIWAFGGSIAYSKVGYYVFDDTYLTNIPSTTTANAMTVENQIVPHLSADNGDANKTLVVSDDPVQMFETALTEARTVELPRDDAGDAFNGLTFKIVRTGGGAFDLLVKNDAGATIGTIASGATGSVTVMYRRSSWVKIGQETW